MMMFVPHQRRRNVSMNFVTEALLRKSLRWQTDLVHDARVEACREHLRYYRSYLESHTKRFGHAR